MIAGTGGTLAVGATNGMGVEPSWSEQVWGGLSNAASETGSWLSDGWLDSTDGKTGMITQGKLGGLTSAAGAISSAYLGYQGLKEARRNREMQERYAKANLFNQANAYNANVRDIGANNAAINGWSDAQRQEYINSNQARNTI